MLARLARCADNMRAWWPSVFPPFVLLLLLLLLPPLPLPRPSPPLVPTPKLLTSLKALRLLDTLCPRCRRRMGRWSGMLPLYVISSSYTFQCRT